MFRKPKLEQLPEKDLQESALSLMAFSARWDQSAEKLDQIPPFGFEAAAERLRTRLHHEADEVNARFCRAAEATLHVKVFPLEQAEAYLPAEQRVLLRPWENVIEFQGGLVVGSVSGASFVHQQPEVTL